MFQNLADKFSQPVAVFALSATVSGELLVFIYTYLFLSIL